MEEQMSGRHTFMFVMLTLLAASSLPLVSQSVYPVLPAGTEIAVRLHERIDSEVAAPGETFDAEIENALEVDEQTVVPSKVRATVSLVATPDVGPGGSEVYAIELQQITVGGKQYPVVTGFASTKPGQIKVQAGGETDVPRGTTETDEILAATARGEGAAVATVRGAGVTFQVVRGPAVEVAAGTVVYFTLAELLTMRPEESVSQ